MLYGRHSSGLGSEKDDVHLRAGQHIQGFHGGSLIVAHVEHKNQSTICEASSMQILVQIQTVHRLSFHRVVRT